MLPAIRNVASYLFVLNKTAHLQIELVKRSSCWSGRHPTSLVPICGHPTAQI